MEYYRAERKKDLLSFATVWNFFRKLKMELTFNPAIPLLGLYPKNPEITNSKEPMHPNVHSSTIYNSQVLEET